MNQFEQKPVNVVNNLTSDSTTDALSAAQGKALNSNKAQFVEIVDSSVSDPVQAIKNKISSIPTNKTLLINLTTMSLSYAVIGFVSPASGYSTFVIQGYDSGNVNYIHHLKQNQGNWTDFDIGILNSKLQTVTLFKLKELTVTTSSLGNANITGLSNSNPIVAINIPNGLGYSMIGRGNDGGYYIKICDSSGNPIANQSVAIKVYYVEA